MEEEIKLPEKLGKYRVVRQIGSGSMGYLYEAVDELLMRRVALKILAPRFSANPEYIERFRREALAAARLFSPNVTQIYEVNTRPPFFFIVMEYVEGLPLEAYIARNGLTLKAIVELFMQIALAINEAHVKKVYHRDIKGENIKVTPEGQTKILDFGIAKIEGTELSDLTRSGIVVGTARYISPEQARGEKIDGRTDIFALGVLLYEILTGDLPWPLKKTATQTIIARGQLTEPPAPMKRGRFNTPPKLAEVVARMCAPLAANRHVSMFEVFSDLKEIHRRIEVAYAHYALEPEKADADISAAAEIEWAKIAVHFLLPVLLAGLILLLF